MCGDGGEGRLGKGQRSSRCEAEIGFAAGAHRGKREFLGGEIDPGERRSGKASVHRGEQFAVAAADIEDVRGLRVGDSIGDDIVRGAAVVRSQTEHDLAGDTRHAAMESIQVGGDLLVGRSYAMQDRIHEGSFAVH